MIIRLLVAAVIFGGWAGYDYVRAENNWRGTADCWARADAVSADMTSPEYNAVFVSCQNNH